MRLVCDATKLRERTGWQPHFTRDEGLQETIEWFRDPANLARFKANEYHSERKPVSELEGAARKRAGDAVNERQPARGTSRAAAGRPGREA